MKTAASTMEAAVLLYVILESKMWLFCQSQALKIRWKSLVFSADVGIGPDEYIVLGW